MRLLRLLCLKIVCTSHAAGLSFRTRSLSAATDQSGLTESVADDVRTRLDLSANLPDHLKSETSNLPLLYANALNELQQLESEPLCHRVAARLLVNKCELLNGKDEATVMIDGGRQIRDFVDAYAASMAICDLERGQFEIPDACDRFRESELIKLPLQEDARLHVSTLEIDLCLSRLAESNSAWTTWISYRHKALRFCEAARVDQEKARNILVYQHLTQVMARLARGVEIDVQTRLQDVEAQATKAADAMRHVESQLDIIQRKLAGAESYVSQDLWTALRNSAETVDDGLQGATELEQVIAVMIASVLDSSKRIAASSVKSSELTLRHQEDADVLGKTLSDLTWSANLVQEQMTLASADLSALSQKQMSLGSDLTQLVKVADILGARQDLHSQQLNKSYTTTDDILIKLEQASRAATSIRDLSHEELGHFTRVKGVWPCILGPIITLLLGSYGLAPSALRNLGLLALGEVLGFSYSKLWAYSIITKLGFATAGDLSNTTEVGF